MTPDKVMIKNSDAAFEAGTILSSKTGAPVSFEELVADLNHVKVIYIGEKHTEQAHHDIQLKVIKSLFAKDPALSIGMEMFDRSYQAVLDDWFQSDLDEETFLKRSHWYANWRYDFELYRGILDFAKQEKLPLVALNLPFNIPSKIRVGGIDYLSEYERQFMPLEIDTTQPKHRAYAQQVFQAHHFSKKVDFENFYLAQCVWEDTMAESIARSLGDDRMVVIVGNGHIQFKYGVPERAFNRTGASLRTIYLARVGEAVALDVADYIWVTE